MYPILYIILFHSLKPTLKMASNNQGQQQQAPPVATASTIVPPRLVKMDTSMNDELECSLHYLPKPLMREFGHVFNDEYLKFGDNSDAMDTDMSSSNDTSTSLRLLAIPTNQHAKEDLVAVGDHIEQEKDRLLNVVSICLCIYLQCILYFIILLCNMQTHNTCKSHHMLTVSNIWQVHL